MIPELPLIDNALLIDNSTLELLQTCPRQMQYSYLNKRILSAPRSALNFGGSVHAGLAFRYQWAGGESVNPDIEATMNNEATRSFKPSEDGLPDWRSLTLVHTLLGEYNRVYGKEPFTVRKASDSSRRLVESTFCLPLGMVHNTPIYYTGKIDLQITDNEGNWIVDHKTSSMFGQSLWDEMEMSSQMLGYCWADWQTSGKLPKGYLINALRTRAPRKLDEYDPTSGIRPDDFERQKFSVTEDAIHAWKENTIALVNTFFFHHSNDYFPQQRKWCRGKYGRCQYFDVCSLPTASHATMLSSSVFMDNTWSPLNKIKEETVE